MRHPGDVLNLLDAIKAGDRRALAKAITLVESLNQDDRTAAIELIGFVMKEPSRKTVRIGVSGAPGVGKSTFIDNFGFLCLELGSKVSVLAVDPSSPISGGSILGDKTRMERLITSEKSYVRPTSAGQNLGGVHSRTREAIILCEFAGYDLILVETVGVGQSEHDVATMVDVFVVLLNPSAGDELQGLKKGIIEVSDLILVTKADGELREKAIVTKDDYSSALTITNAGDQKKVLAISSLKNEDIQTVQSEINSILRRIDIQSKRQQQNLHWYHQLVAEEAIRWMRSNDVLKNKMSELEKSVQSSVLNPVEATSVFLKSLIDLLK
jgi:LAO/AO transport system kinase